MSVFVMRIFSIIMYLVHSLGNPKCTDSILMDGFHSHCMHSVQNNKPTPYLALAYKKKQYCYQECNNYTNMTVDVQYMAAHTTIAVRNVAAGIFHYILTSLYMRGGAGM